MPALRYNQILKRLTSNRITTTLLHFTAGAVFGVFASYTVNCTLVEITINSIFSTYFGVLFILLGCLILWRILAGDHTAQQTMQTTLLIFSIAVLLCGVLCFMLDSTYITHMSPNAKIPLYALLGISVAFALLFSTIDCINYIITFFSLTAKSLIHTETQLYVMIITSILLGMSFGVIFGMLDIEDSKLSEIQSALVRDENISSVVGALIGGCAAVVNMRLTSKHNSYNSNYINVAAATDAV